MAATPRARSRSKDRNIFIALGIAAIIVIAAIYIEAPKALNTSSTTTNTSSANLGPLNYPNVYGNSDNWAYSTDTQIPADNASTMAESAYTSLPVQTTPFLAGGASAEVALDGYSYIANIGNYELYSQDVETQNTIYDASIPNSPVTPLPYVTPFFHIQATTTVGSSPEIWLSTPWGGVYGFASVGAVNANFAFNMTVPADAHNVGTYSWAAPNFVVDESRAIMVSGLNVNTTGIPGRGFVQGWKLDTGNASLAFSGTSITVKTASNLWTDYLSPPQDGSDPSWEMTQLNSIPHVWEFNGTSAVDLRTLPSSTVQSLISNDWTATSGNAVFSTGPESNSTWLTDAATDTTYIATSAPQTVSLNDSFNGPALFSSSIIALNTTSGAILWTFQVTPHDVWGWGCKGNIAMLPATIGGTSEQVIAKQCENGYLYLLNPTTGALLYSGQVPGVVRASGASIPNIQSSTQMTESLASVTGANSSQQPVTFTNTNIAYDPDNALLLGAVGPQSNPLGGEAALGAQWNSTAYAFDLAKLTFAWQAPVPNQEFSFIQIANGIAYMGTYQGEIYVASTVTGSQLTDIHAAMAIQSLIVMNGQHNQPVLVASGYSIATKQQIEVLSYTPGGLGITG